GGKRRSPLEVSGMHRRCHALVEGENGSLSIWKFTRSRKIDTRRAGACACHDAHATGHKRSDDDVSDLRAIAIRILKAIANLRIFPGTACRRSFGGRALAHVAVSVQHV